jgi:hypothetical protein
MVKTLLNNNREDFKVQNKKIKYLGNELGEPQTLNLKLGLCNKAFANKLGEINRPRGNPSFKDYFDEFIAPQTLAFDYEGFQGNPFAERYQQITNYKNPKLILTKPSNDLNDLITVADFRYLTLRLLEGVEDTALPKAFGYDFLVLITYFVETGKGQSIYKWVQLTKEITEYDECFVSNFVIECKKKYKIQNYHLYITPLKVKGLYITPLPALSIEYEFNIPE